MCFEQVYCPRVIIRHLRSCRVCTGARRLECRLVFPLLLPTAPCVHYALWRLTSEVTLAEACRSRIVVPKTACAPVKKESRYQWHIGNQS